MSTKSLHELKQESKNASAKDKNTITDSDYRLRDKKNPKDRANTINMTPEAPVATEDVKQELEATQNLLAEALKAIEALKADKENVDSEDAEQVEVTEDLTPAQKRAATLAAKKAKEDAEAGE